MKFQIPHNSGFSLDACETSQFEQHLREVCDLPLGNPALNCGGAVMGLPGEYAQNDYLPQRQQLAALPMLTSIGTVRPNHVLVESWGTSPSGWMPKTDLSAIAQTIESIWYGDQDINPIIPLPFEVGR